MIQIGEDNASYRYDATVESLIVDGVNINPTANNKEGLINMYSDSVIKNLILENLFINSGYSPVSPLIKGPVNNAICTNINSRQEVTFFGGTVGTLLASNMILSGGALYSTEPETVRESNIV